MHGVITRNLKRIPDERGYLQEILREDDPSYTRFGQVYCTATYPGVVKGWHLHKQQTDNICCVSGMIKLVIFDPRPESDTYGTTQEIFIGDLNPQLVQISPGLYHGWKTVSEHTSLVINVPDRVYNYKEPDEYRVDPHTPDIAYDWSRKDK